METVRYVHAADLHLDAPFVGIAQNGAPGLATALKDATFTALENLALLCEQEKPDFLLLAGDIYNQEERSVRAQLRLRDVCERLRDHNIKVFICHGNHDPISSRLTAINWPDNVTIFGPEPSFATVLKDGKPLALVHGASHAGSREGRNLAQMFQRDATQDCFQIGLLHCNVDGAVASDRYARCSLADLRAADLDAWALGHAHERKILCRQPFVAYSGNTQGLNSNETGPKGCYLVTAEFRGFAWECEERFVDLAPIQWQKAKVDVEAAATFDAVAASIEQATATARDAALGCSGVILSLVLAGRTILDSELRKQDVIDDLTAQMRPFSDGAPAVWPRSIAVDTATPIERGNTLDRDDLLGEVARVASNMEANSARLHALAQKVLAPLYGNRRYSALLEWPDQTVLDQLLISAQRICQDMLEGR